jgi:hypothetical protein
MQSWVPRRPSPGLKARLFRKETLAREAPSRSAWLVPATVGLFLMLSFFNHPTGDLSERYGVSRPSIAIVASNHTAPGSCLKAAPSTLGTLGWTNSRGSTSSIDSFFAPLGTNY